jgi:hypothetical protein
MQHRPRITTALPRRRWQLGDHTATLLGDIESPDDIRYRYILALVPMGETEPALYVTCEEAPPARALDGRWELRVINSAMADVLDSADHWGDLDSFAEQALDLARQVLGLRNAEAHRLL